MSHVEYEPKCTQQEMGRGVGEGKRAEGVLPTIYIIKGVVSSCTGGWVGGGDRGVGKQGVCRDVKRKCESDDDNDDVCIVYKSHPRQIYTKHDVVVMFRHFRPLCSPSVHPT